MSYLGRSRVLARAITQQATRNAAPVRTVHAMHAPQGAAAPTPSSTTLPQQPTSRKARKEAAAATPVAKPAEPTAAAAAEAVPTAESNSSKDAATPATPSSSGSSVPPPPFDEGTDRGGRTSRRILYSLVASYVILAAVFTISDDARRWAWREYPELCVTLHLPPAERQRKKLSDYSKKPSEADQKVAAVPAIVAALPVPSKQLLTKDPSVQARIDEVLAPKAAVPAPVAAPAAAVAAPAARCPHAAGAAAQAAGASKPLSSSHGAVIYPFPVSSELAVMLGELAEAEASLAPFMRTQDETLKTELASFEAGLKQREVRHLASLEAEQKFTLETAIARQAARLARANHATHQPKVDRFKEDRDLEEENKWRARLYDGLLAQNTKKSEEADYWLQTEEAQIRKRFTGYVSQLRNATEALDGGRIKELRGKLSLARHTELRSKQAHKLSAALLSLSEVVDQNHVGFEAPWAVVAEVAKADDTLAAAIRSVAPSTVAGGIYSIASLKQAFHALSYELKRTTFLPDRADLWTLGREAMAHLFATLTLSETGGVIIPPAAVASSSASAAAIDSRHQAADYAHYINASTYLNSNALELALAELEAMQSSRRVLMQQFIDELRKTVAVQQAVRVVRMRVLALNAQAAKQTTSA